VTQIQLARPVAVPLKNSEGCSLDAKAKLLFSAKTDTAPEETGQGTGGCGRC
jgi:hypothetical protein